MGRKHNVKLYKDIVHNKGYKFYLMNHQGEFDIKLPRNQVSGTMLVYDFLKRTNLNHPYQNVIQRSISSVKEYLDQINYVFNTKHVDPVEMYVFRGQVDATWGLTPSIVRKIARKYTENGFARINSETYNDNIKRFEINEYNMFINSIGRSGDLAKLNRDDISPSKHDSNWFAAMQHMGFPTRLLDVVIVN